MLTKVAGKGTEADSQPTDQASEQAEARLQHSDMRPKCKAAPCPKAAINAGKCECINRVWL